MDLCNGKNLEGNNQPDLTALAAAVCRQTASVLTWTAPKCGWHEEPLRVARAPHSSHDPDPHQPSKERRDRFLLESPAQPRSDLESTLRFILRTSALTLAFIPALRAQVRTATQTTLDVSPSSTVATPTSSP
jgi:hypothetical protein